MRENTSQTDIKRLSESLSHGERERSGTFSILSIRHFLALQKDIANALKDFMPLELHI
jgi:hypothetical protein